MVGCWGRFLFAGLLAGKGFSAADVSTYNATCVDETTTLLQTTVPRNKREATVEPSAGSWFKGDYGQNCDVTCQSVQGTCVRDVVDNVRGSTEEESSSRTTALACALGDNPWKTTGRAVSGFYPVDRYTFWCTSENCCTSSSNIHPYCFCAGTLAGVQVAFPVLPTVVTTCDEYDTYETSAQSPAPTSASAMLAMKIAGSSPTFRYDSAYWTNTQLLNENLAADVAGDAKYAAFNTVPVHGFRVCFDAAGTRCVHHEFPGQQYASLRDMFSLPTDCPTGVAVAVGFTAKDLVDVAPHARDKAISCDDGTQNFAKFGPGINVKARTGGNGVETCDGKEGSARIGFVGNNAPSASLNGNEWDCTDERNFWDVDYGFGIGLLGQGDGTTASLNIASGWTYWWDWENRVQGPADAWLYVCDTAGPCAASTMEAPAALASAVGDPHLVNLRGETFDLNMAGEHLLLQIPQGSGEELEVVGFVEHLPIQKSGQSPCEQFLFKTFTVRGNYVDAHKGEIVIDAGQNLALKGFGTTHQQNGTTTPTTYDSLLKRNAPTTVGKTQLWVCSDSNSKRQRSLCKQLGSMKSAGHRQLTVFTRKPSMFVMELHGAGSLPMHLSFSRFEGASPSYLNLALHGFGPSNEVGGLLGSDDHTEVSKIKANCIQTHHSKERPAARRHAEAHRNATLTK